MEKHVEKCWIITSIFYNQSNWHKLICNFFNKYIDSIKESLEVYYFFLSKNRGDHITICLKLKKNAGELRINFFENLKNYLESEKSAERLIEFGERDYFIDYPNNSFLVHNGYYPTNNSWRKNQLCTFSGIISRAILAVLVDDEIGMGSMYTFMIYLQFGLTKIAFPDLEKAREKILMMADVITQKLLLIEKKEDLNLLDQIDELFYTKLENNKDGLNDILNDIWRPKINSDLEWMDEWLFQCELYLRYVKYEDAFTSLTKLLFEHFGISQNSKFLITSVLKLI